MSHPEQYDVVVLGSGAHGKLLSWTLANGSPACGPRRPIRGDAPALCRRAQPKHRRHRSRKGGRRDGRAGVPTPFD